MLKVPALLCKYVSLCSPPAFLEVPQYDLPDLSVLIRKFDDIFFLYCFTARFAWDAKAAELNNISFAVEGTAKENNPTFIKVILYWNTNGYFFIPQGCMFLLSGVLALWNAKPIPLGSAESKKETNSLRPLRLSGDFKLSNYNTIPYLRIHVLSAV